MSDKLKNLLVRTASGAVLAVVLLGGLLWSPLSWTVVLLVVLIGGMREFYALTEKRGAQPQKWLGFVIGILSLAGSIAMYNDVLLVGQAPLVLLLVFLVFVFELFRAKPDPMANIGTTWAGVLYVAMPLSLLYLIPAYGGEWQPLRALFFILIIWTNDVFAYLTGMSIGRHKMFERISPKKSWEGFAGGIVGAVAMGVVAAYCLDAVIWKWVGLAVVSAVSGVLGDFVESMFKRAAGVKDSGNLIPGHGGILDRFDALLLATPFVFVYIYLVL